MPDVDIRRFQILTNRSQRTIMKISQLFKCFIAVSITLVLNGCATMDNLLKARVDNLVVAPDFVPENYYQEKFLITPAFSTIEDLEFNAGEKRNLSNSMKSNFTSKRPEMVVFTHDEGVKALGSESYARLAKEFKSTGMLSQTKLSEISSKLGVRYVVFTNVFDDVIDNDWRESREDNHIKVTVSGDREVKAVYTVVDAKTGDTAWSGVMKGSEFGYETYERHSSSHGGYGEATGALALIDVLLGEDPRDRYQKEKDERDYQEKYPAPRYAKVSSIVSDLNKDFVLNIPALKVSK